MQGEKEDDMGTQTPWAVLLCKWNDVQIEVKPRELFEKLFTTPDSGTGNMVDFFDDVSHGSIDLSGRLYRHIATSL